MAFFFFLILLTFYFFTMAVLLFKAISNSIFSSCISILKRNFLSKCRCSLSIKKKKITKVKFQSFIASSIFPLQVKISAPCANGKASEITLYSTYHTFQEHLFEL